MSPTSIAKARLRLEAASVRVAAIEVETAAEIAVDAADGRAAAVVVVDAGGVAVVVAAADGTAVADTAADDTRGQTFGSHLKWECTHLLISILELRLWSRLFFCCCPRGGNCQGNLH